LRAKGGEKAGTLRAGLQLIYARYFLLSSNGRKLSDSLICACPHRKTGATFPGHALESHAYTDCRHVAQSFALPKFPCHTTCPIRFDGPHLIALPVAVFWEEVLKARAFDDVKVRSSVECRKFFQKAA
jgi:hypothetical protein